MVFLQNIMLLSENFCISITSCELSQHNSPTEIPTSEQTDRTTAPTDSMTTNLGGPQTVVAVRPLRVCGAAMRQRSRAGGLGAGPRGGAELGLMENGLRK